MFPAAFQSPRRLATPPRSGFRNVTRERPPLLKQDVLVSKRSPALLTSARSREDGQA